MSKKYNMSKRTNNIKIKIMWCKNVFWNVKSNINE